MKIKNFRQGEWGKIRAFFTLITNEGFEIKALSIGGELLDANQIDVLAKLPTMDQARSMLMSVMLAPVTKFARTANEIPSKVTRVDAAVRDKKKEAA